MTIRILAMMLIGYAWLWVLALIGYDLWLRHKLKQFDLECATRLQIPFHTHRVSRSMKTVATSCPADFSQAQP